MKICYFNSFYDSGIVAGVEFYLQSLVKSVSAENEAVVITTTGFNFKNIFKPQVEKRGALTIYRFFPLNFAWYAKLHKYPLACRLIWYLGDIWNWQVYLMLKKIIKLEKPDLLHSHNIYGLSCAVFSVGKKMKIPHLHTLHDYQLLEPGGTMLRNSQLKKSLTWFERLFVKIKLSFAKKINQVLAPSQFIIDLHKKYGYFPNQPTQVLRLGADLETIVPLEEYKDTQKRFVYIGRIVREKGLLDLIQAFKNISDSNAVLEIAGQGPLEVQAKKLASGDSRIKFLGFVVGEEKIKLIREAYYLVLPSICYDNSPVTIYEAFSQGVPVIASRLGGIPELIDNGESGWLFTAGNISEIEKIITQTLEQVAVRDKQAETALHVYQTRLSKDAHDQILKEIYGKYL